MENNQETQENSPVPRRKPGRPSKYNEERIKILLECLEEAMPIEIACRYAKITPPTFHNWMNSQENFFMQVEYARSRAERLLIKETREQNGSWKILKNIDPQNFKDDPVVVFNFEAKETIKLANGKVIEDER